MKILHVLDHSEPQVDGYAIRSRHIINIQKELGLFPTVMTSPLHRAIWKENPQIFHNIRYFRVSNNNIATLKFVREFQIIMRIKKMIENLYANEPFDIIHAHSPSLNGMAALLASKKIKVPYVYECRALWEDAAIDQQKFSKKSIKYLISRKVESIVFKHANAVTAIAQYLIDEIHKRGVPLNNIFHIPNGVNTNSFIPLDTKDEILNKHGIESGNNIILGFIGSFYKFEGLDILLDTMSILKKSHPEFKLLLVGGGEEMDHISNRVASQSLSNVHMVGRVPFEEINHYYAAMDIMIYPRLSERITELTTPLKPLEAMAMEKAVIGSDVGGIKELVNDGVNGILFKASDSNDLVNKILSLTDKKRRETFGIQARRFVVDEKEWKRIVERYIDIYSSVL